MVRTLVLTHQNASDYSQTRFSVSNAPESTSVAELCKASLMRWPIEQCFQEAKDKLGMDHYEFRSWAAWHQHMLMVFMRIYKGIAE
jgi:FOG: Transposase